MTGTSNADHTCAARPIVYTHISTTNSF